MTHKHVMVTKYCQTHNISNSLIAWYIITNIHIEKIKKIIRAKISLYGSNVSCFIRLEKSLHSSHPRDIYPQNFYITRCINIYTNISPLEILYFCLCSLHSEGIPSCRPTALKLIQPLGSAVAGLNHKNSHNIPKTKH